MDVVTQALASVTLSRAVFARTTRLATPILLATALAPDLDLLSSFRGADAYLRFHRTLLHSLLGVLILAVIIAAGAWLADGRLWRSKSGDPLKLGQAMGICLIGVALHDVLDLVDSGGVQLLWPFHPKWYAWNLTANLDPWILAVFLGGLLLQTLLNLVSEEIGGQKRKQPGMKRWAIAALLIVAAYIFARDALHSRAVDLLESRSYRGSIPIAVAAFPTSTSPFDWRGVVAIDNALIELEVPLGPGASFDSERGVVHYKPDPTSALAAAQQSATVMRFLAFAKYPLAALHPGLDGTQFEFRDLRFTSASTSDDNLVAVVVVDWELHIVHEEIRFARSKAR
ncbi:MAG: metal-dependent hydrolase [Candidatus Acidiferrales bacterium]